MMIAGSTPLSARHNIYDGFDLEWPIRLIPLGPSFFNQKLSHIEHFIVDGGEKINVKSLKNIRF